MKNLTVGKFAVSLSLLIGVSFQAMGVESQNINSNVYICRGSVAKDNIKINFYYTADLDFSIIAAAEMYLPLATNSYISLARNAEENAPGITQDNGLKLGLSLCKIIDSNTSECRTYGKVENDKLILNAVTKDDAKVSVTCGKPVH